MSGHYILWRASKQRSFIPDLLLLDKTLTSGAIQPLAYMVYIFVWHRGQNLALPGSIVNFWPPPRPRWQKFGIRFVTLVLAKALASTVWPLPGG